MNFYLCLSFDFVSFQQNEVTEQSKILAKIRAEHEKEQDKLDELHVSVREIKAKMLQIKGQMQTFDNDIQAKQKSKDDLSENVSKREAMVAYHQKQKKHLTDAMVKYEVSVYTGCSYMVRPKFGTHLCQFQLQKELEKLREKLARLEATAQKTGPRIEVTHTEEQLAKLIKKNELKLK